MYSKQLPFSLRLRLQLVRLLPSVARRKFWRNRTGGHTVTLFPQQFRSLSFEFILYYQHGWRIQLENNLITSLSVKTTISFGNMNMIYWKSGKPVKNSAYISMNKKIITIRWCTHISLRYENLGRPSVPSCVSSERAGLFVQPIRRILRSHSCTETRCHLRKPHIGSCRLAWYPSRYSALRGSVRRVVRPCIATARHNSVCGSGWWSVKRSWSVGRRRQRTALAYTHVVSWCNDLFLEEHPVSSSPSQLRR